MSSCFLLHRKKVKLALGKYRIKLIYLNTFQFFQAHKPFVVLEKEITDFGPLFFIIQASLLSR